MNKALLAALLALPLLSACENMPENNHSDGPPVAEKRPSERSYHGLVLEDDYFWLKDPSYPDTDDEDVLDYLRAENAWFERQMAPRHELVETLFEEMKGRMEEDLAEVPWIEGGYEYRWRYSPGSEYKLWERRASGSDEYETILDEAKEAEGHEFFSLGNLSISPDGKRLAWSADFNGSEREHLVVDDLATGERFADGSERVSSGGLAWAADSDSIYYSEVEEDAWYTLRVKQHVIGTSAAKDREIFYNPDRTLFLSLSESRSREYVLITMDDRTTTYTYHFPTDASEAKPELVSPAREGVRYVADHANGQFYIRTNDEHVNFRIVTAPEDTPDAPHWQSLFPPSDDIYYRDITVFDDFVAIEETSEGLSRVRVRLNSGEEHYVRFDEDVYTASLGINADPAAEFLRISYESMITPDTVYDYIPAQKKMTLRRQQQIPSGYNKSLYTTGRIWVTARDGVEVPVSIVHRKDVVLDGQAPMLLYGYGAYSHTVNPTFSTLRPSLLDRGLIWGIAHIRGGAAMGYQWYLDGKLEKRTNTFNDFVDVSRYLVENDYTNPERLAIMGGSAGGELVGAAVVQAPELYQAAVLQVPFVDVLNTMLDETLPLTPPEWLEWGNPIESKAAFELIQSYSPYDNIEAMDYPAMMVTGGLNDPRVTYWEPAKWTAKMRGLKTDDNELIMKINMGAGHQGKTGRYASVYEWAQEFAFVLTQLGVESVDTQD
ncbi:S9 family peptidase [Halioglobus sp. HI00S01]|uniref:S9 family peptidase n=2 Tax=Halioglobus sp. HI00S01 TaxID=1822214 RepID=UPI000A4512D1|nr:S9 family peptidase [Halioglobus sp. HI00S01]